VQKSDYLVAPDVSEFTAWLSGTLEQKTPTHSYTMPDGRHFAFYGLWEARETYEWDFSFRCPGAASDTRGYTYADSENALRVLRKGLKEVVDMTISPINADTKTRDWSKAVVQWGGVTNRNANWLDAHTNGLTKRLADTARLLSRQDDSMTSLRADVGRFNAGMTKIYSLLVDDFIIFDSRVAGTLAWFVALWCHTSGRACVPPLLRVRCLRAKEHAAAKVRKVRNPTCSHFYFPWVNTQSQHAHWNLRASWILSSAVSTAKASNFSGESQPLRALEAAFFMWGYDLAATPACPTCSGSALQSLL